MLDLYNQKPIDQAPFDSFITCRGIGRKMITMENQFKLYSGRHVAEFLGAEEQEFEYGPCLLWKFCISYGRNQTIVTRITGPKPTPGSSCCVLLSGLLGRPVSEFDLLYIDTRIGDSYSILVRYKNDYPRVENVSLLSTLL